MNLNSPFWSLSAEETMAKLETSHHGLKFNDVGQRHKQFGFNEVEYRGNLSRFVVFLNQFRSPLILILLFAGILTIVLGEWIESGVIFAAVLLNTWLGYWQESKAENTLVLLRSYIRTRTRVIRDGQDHEIDATELVPGDIIRLTQGDRVPADARLIFSNNLEVDEAILTGESLPVEKKIVPVSPAMPVSERTSMVFSGTIVSDGLADAVITAIGTNTEFGKIAALVSEREKEVTPLQRAVKDFSVKFGFILAIVITSLFILGLFFQYGIFEMFLISIAVAVAAVPEGLPITLTVILAIGVQRLAAKKGVVRKLIAAETMGSVSVILTDKTGTLTQAQMQLTNIIPVENNGELYKRQLLKMAVLSSDVIVENSNEAFDKWEIVGRPIEVALVKGAVAQGIFYKDIIKEIEIIDRLPFDSRHKLSATLIREEKTKVILFGAPEWLVKLSNLSDEKKRYILEEIESQAYAGERVLGLAIKEIPEGTDHNLQERSFDNLNFLGLFMFRDPLRPTVRQAIEHIAQSGVRTIIVTGDHQGTAEAVARELGLIDGKNAVITGEDMIHLSVDELRSRADDVVVYARVSPEQKMQIVRLYQEKGEIVSVTGDGINDAPALKVADIGIAVGSGTDVAKSVADLVILDDNFETIVASIEEGRHTLNNIRKAIVYLFSSIFDELLLIGGSLLLGLALPLNALQILFVNLFADSFPAIAFAQERQIDRVGNIPSQLRNGIFDKNMKFLIFVVGTLTSVFLFVLYFILNRAGYSQELVRTFIFASFATYSLLLAFSIRSLEKSIFTYNPFSNHYLTFGVFLGVAMTLTTVYAPFVQDIFRTVSLPPFWIFWVLGVGVVNILVVELGKLLLRRNRSKI